MASAGPAFPVSRISTSALLRPTRLGQFPGADRTGGARFARHNHKWALNASDGAKGSAHDAAAGKRVPAPAATAALALLPYKSTAKRGGSAKNGCATTGPGVRGRPRGGDRNGVRFQARDIFRKPDRASVRRAQRDAPTADRQASVHDLAGWLTLQNRRFVGAGRAVLA